MDEPRKYEFDWSLLGDLSTGRPNLGPQVGVETYRLMQFCFRDVLEREYGAEQTDRIFYESGRLAGAEYAANVVGEHEGFQEFVKSAQDSLRRSGIGVLRVEEADAEGGRFVLTVSEDLDCSGLPELGHGVCTFDEGFIAALLESHTGKAFSVSEIDCWCTGDRTCRFEANAVR